MLNARRSIPPAAGRWLSPTTAEAAPARARRASAAEEECMVQRGVMEDVREWEERKRRLIRTAWFVGLALSS